jgi:hypothetical protein
MKMQNGKSSYMPLLVAGMAVVLFSTAGVARMMGWGPGLAEYSGDLPELEQAALVPASRTARAAARCAECGEIVSLRETERPQADSAPGVAGSAAAGSRRGPTRSGEIIVRMADGTDQVINDDNLARWRVGESLIVIAGSNPSSQ